MKFNSSQIFEAHPPNLYWLLIAAVDSFHFVPKYVSKVKVIFLIFRSETIVSLENGSKGANFYNAVI